MLQVVRDQVGKSDQDRIDDIVGMLDPRCPEALADSEPNPTRPASPAPPPEEPLQTEKTPPDHRTPTVFVSYSHRDEVFAARLIADLQKAGHAVWIDVTKLKGGDEWVRAISEGIINSYAFVVVVTPHALDSTWVQTEILWAKQRERLIIPLILDAAALDSVGFFVLNPYQGVRFDRGYEGALSSLLSTLPSPTIPVTEQEPQLVPEDHPREAKRKRERTQRESELEYLDRLRLEVLLNTEKYTALAGQSQITRETGSGRLAAVVMRPEFALLSGDRDQQKEVRRFENAVEEIIALRRAIVLGEPGAGKTTTLWRLASDLAQKAIDDSNAPIPLVIRLGRWTDEFQTFERFVAHELGNLGPHLNDLLRSGRAALLFDGLNEIPVSQRKRDRANKDRQVERFIREHRNLLAVVSCRAQDYNTDLGFDRIEIQPLDPIRIREFLTRYLGSNYGETLFERLVGSDAIETEGRFLDWAADKITERDPLQVFWIERALPDGLKWGLLGGRNWFWTQWIRDRDNPSSLLMLARNPYMLSMLAQVYENTGELPQNRGKLFERFVSTLFAREQIIRVDKVTKRENWADEAVDLLHSLSDLAFEMQLRRSEIRDGEGDALTVFSFYDAERFLSQRQLYLANSASLLSVGESVRYTHQLLQEYFAAVALRGRVFEQYGSETTYLAKDDLGLKASSIWKPDRWWERTNWEESAVLFAGLFADDCTPVIEWLMDANPEVAADCIVRSGAKTPRETLLRLRERWIPRLTNLRGDPSPLARAAVGRALGMLEVDGEPLDNRKGVSIIKRDGIVLPDIEWCDVPAGEFIYQEGQILALPAFQIAIYPITSEQYLTFIDDLEGFRDIRWWIGLSDDKYRRKNQNAPGEQFLLYGNHPREYVSWYDAIAFCRWLSWRLGGGYDLDLIDQWAVRLPTEYEWEEAARGPNGLQYPYGHRFDSSRGNTSETGIGRTSAVGIFPDGASPYGVMEMSGNVSEWCLSSHEAPKFNTVAEDLGSDEPRVVRGGSWRHDRVIASATARGEGDPVDRSSLLGFRLCRPPLP
ncbi:MAG: SUMF1/EgtB/PvdO family nonheme iron enzyme [Phototrophicaceae bacterium]